PDTLPAPEHGFVAASTVVLLDLDPQVGVTQPDLITGGGTVELGVLAAVDLAHCHSSRDGSADGSNSAVSPAVPVTRAPARGGGCGLSSGSAPGVPNGTTLRGPCTYVGCGLPRICRPGTCRVPPSRTNSTALLTPGSNRTDVPAGTSSR